MAKRFRRASHGTGTAARLPPRAARAGLFGLQRHHPHGGQEFLLRLPGSARRKREALYAVYAFMRRCDDITDDSTLSFAERRQKLDNWLDALHRAQQGHPTDDAILLALTDAQRRYRNPRWPARRTRPRHRHGYRRCRSTVQSSVPASTVQYKTFEDLRLYCYRVASVVGLVCIHIFGYRDPAAEPLAERCGLAFQLTNIIRDVKEDAAMGRVYLPEEDLAKFGLSAQELLATPDPARFRPYSRWKRIAPASSTLPATNYLPIFRKTASPRSGCWSTSTAACWKKSPRSNTTSSPPKSP